MIWTGHLVGMHNTPILGKRPCLGHQFNYQLSIKLEIQGTNVSCFHDNSSSFTGIRAKPIENPQSTNYKGHEIML